MVIKYEIVWFHLFCTLGYKGMYLQQKEQKILPFKTNTTCFKLILLKDTDSKSLESKIVLN